MAWAARSVLSIGEVEAVFLSDPERACLSG